MGFRQRALTAVLTVALPLVAAHEGLRYKAYLDAVGVPTICYGHTEGVRLGDVKSQKECVELLKQELTEYIEIVNKYVTVHIPDTTRAALASFVYNVGEGNFAHSTLLKKLNAGDREGACNELKRWNRAGGRVLDGLTTRREEERELCLRN